MSVSSDASFHKEKKEITIVGKEIYVIRFSIGTFTENWSQNIAFGAVIVILGKVANLGHLQRMRMELVGGVDHNIIEHYAAKREVNYGVIYCFPSGAR